MAWIPKAANLDGRKALYLESGDPRSPHVLLLIHPFPVGMRMWETLEVPDPWRALAPALPGFDGVEPPPRDSTSIDDYARFVLDFMKHLRIDSAVLGGLSLGGYVSFALWRLDHLPWRALILADTRAGADTEQGRAGREKMLEIIRTKGTRGVADDMSPKLLGLTTHQRQPQLVDHVRRLIERQTSEGITAAVERLRDRPDSTSMLPEIGVPTLVVVGEEDVLTPPAEAEKMHAQLEDARLVRIPDAGHLSSMENPAAFNAALASFLSGIRR